MKETECGGGGSVSVWCAVVNENEPAGGHFGQLARHPNNETKRCDVWGRDMATHIAESKWVKGKRGLWNATSGHCCLPVVCPSVIQWHDVTHLLTRSPNMKCHFSLLDLGKQRVKIRIYCTIRLVVWVDSVANMPIAWMWNEQLSGHQIYFNQQQHLSSTKAFSGHISHDRLGQLGQNYV